MSFFCRIKSVLVITSLCFTFSAFGNATHLVLPQCLFKNVNFQTNVLAKTSEYVMIGIDQNNIEPLGLLADKIACGRFVDVSLALKQARTIGQTDIVFLKQFLIPSMPGHVNQDFHIKQLSKVKEKINDIDIDFLWSQLVTLTQFNDRSATTFSGKQASEWLKAKFDHMALEAGRTDTDSYFVDSIRYHQASVVTVIGKDLQAPAIVLGAHMDTFSNKKPGADDDGSGSATLLEVARLLLNSNETLKAPIYIIWYAAEERGLVGSEQVVQAFKSKNIDVNAVLQLDMTAWTFHTLTVPYAFDHTVWLIDDFTNPELNNFVATLVKNYTDSDVERTRCGYACSDHASWHRLGFRAAFPFEARLGEHNPFIHSALDDLDSISIEKMRTFTSLALAFALELAL